jgi:hypothetical protein
LLLLAAIATLPSPAAADSEVPPTVRDLLPAALQVKNQGWSVFKEEFGTIISGQMQAFFPDSVSCDYTIGPELNLKIGSDSAWEGSSEQLEMFAQMTLPDFQAQGESMLSFTKNHLQGSGNPLSVGVPQQEPLPNGHVTYLEFTWTCAKNTGGRNVMLDGYARRGATVLDGGKEEALALARDIFAKFEQLDIDALRQ